ncbi:hypothetical protein L1987_12432 [Smallanthus sonchifolius]|uniref:Uncharacterized protein n=1 Tax=Smallanthus sonchifolius TaxID=185202 RepID=A0ACB9JDQ5_9ASTR|nr:hypothetical protein L1987_12432 [Smallanthus sonchifolius]
MGEVYCRSKESREEKARLWLGTFDTPEQAAFKLHGSRAKVNFPLLIGCDDSSITMQKASGEPHQPSSSMSSASAPPLETMSNGNDSFWSIFLQSMATATSRVEEVGSDHDSMLDFQENIVAPEELRFPVMELPPATTTAIRSLEVGTDYNTFWDLQIDTLTDDDLLFL